MVRALSSVLVALVAVLALAEAAAAAQPRRRNNAAAASARKKQMAASIRSQISAAQQVLAAAEAAGGASQAQLDEIRGRLSKAREAMAEAVDEERQARQHLRGLEEKILAAQPSDSALGRAKAQLDNARAKLDDLRDRRSGKTINSDPEYRAAVEAVTAARREYNEQGAIVLEKVQEWQDASENLRKMASEHRKEQAGAGSALGAMGASRNLRNAQEIAAAARQVIAVGEARLRQMGEKVPTSNSAAANKKGSAKK
jgi:chromosome segregation ATPase